MTAPSPVESLSDGAKAGIVCKNSTVNETVCHREIGRRRTGVERDIAHQSIVVRLAIWQIIKDLCFPPTRFSRELIFQIVELERRNHHSPIEIAQFPVFEDFAEDLP